MNNNDNETLNYISSIDVFTPEKSKPSVDMADEKTLVKIVRVIDEQIAIYHTIDGMRQFKNGYTKFNADQREAMCEQYVLLLSSFKQLVTNAIDGIKGEK